MRIQVKELIYGAILAALAILIPVAFQGWLQVNIPPFSATIGSHIPSFLAMFISPWAAAFVGIGSTLGFLMTLGPVVAVRAAVHILFGVVGAILFRKGFKPSQILLMILPIHALEAFVVLPFGFNLYTAFVVVGIGTVFHHLVDSVLTLGLYSSLSKAGIAFDNIVPQRKGLRNISSKI